jgi:hypothetical protein
MKLEKRLQKTPKAQKEAESFMKDSTHQDHSEFLVKRDVEALKDMGKTREEIIEDRAKKGFLKTDTDAKILESVLQKQRVEDNPKLYEQRKKEKAREQAWVNHYIQQHQIESQKQQPQKHKKYF